MADIVPDEINTDGGEGVQDSQVPAEIAINLDLANNTGGTITEGQSPVEETKIDEAAKSAASSIGVDPDNISTAVDDAADGNPTTPDGVKVDTYTKESLQTIKDGISKETPQSLIEKFGPRIAMLLLIIGGFIGAIVGLKQMADALSGCFQIQQDNENSISHPVKIMCAQANCNCTNIGLCKQPQCGGTTGYNYYYSEVSALQAFAMLPGIMAAGVANGVFKPASSFLSKAEMPLIIIGAIVVIGIIAYGILKYINTRAENKDPIGGMSFKNMRNGKYKFMYR